MLWFYIECPIITIVSDIGPIYKLEFGWDQYLITYLVIGGVDVSGYVITTHWITIIDETTTASTTGARAREKAIIIIITAITTFIPTIIDSSSGSLWMMQLGVPSVFLFLVFETGNDHDIFICFTYYYTDIYFYMNTYFRFVSQTILGLFLSNIRISAIVCKYIIIIYKYINGCQK